ncbi:MAG TPA: hypothetical protein VFW87_13580, partial [Pirellulales bacterium]|nr:hypothetical protein [Pirellulales bacterium]
MLAAGAVDTAFGENGVALAAFGASNATALASALEPDGKLVVAGGLQDDQHHELGFVVARFNADGSLDNSFGSGGEVTISPGGMAHQLAIQPDGKILIAGDDAGNLQQNVLVRLDADGTVDGSFGNNGSVVLNGISSDFALLPGGKIVSVQGDTGSYQLTRFNANGSLDTSFGQGGTVTAAASTALPPTDIALDTSGRILVSGYVNQTNPAVNYVAVTRFNADGSLDTTFGSGGSQRTTLRGVVDDLNCLALQPDGKILAGGLSVHPVTQVGWDLVLMRYNSDGTLDTTFGANGIVIDAMGSLDSAINRMFVEPNGTIVAAGRLGEDAALYRFHSNGSLDDSFGSGGVAAAMGFQHDGYGAVEQADGKYLLAGTAGSPTQFAVERFTGETPVTTSGIADISVPAGTTSQSVVLTGAFTGGSVPANQLTYSLVDDTNPALFTSVGIGSPVGTLTLNFTPQQTGNALLTLRASDPDGAFTDTTFQVTVAAPSTDDGFGTAGIATATFSGGDARDYAVAVQDDGKVVEAGTFTQGSTTKLAVARFNADGSLDASFGTGGEVLTPVSNASHEPISVFGTSLLVQPDGKIVVGASADGFQDFLLARYNANGQLDSTFGAGGIALNALGNERQITLQPDGKIVAVGGDANGFVVARYNADGSLDSTFGTGGVKAFIISSSDSALALAVALQGDGKIVAAGLTNDGAKRNIAVARLDTDGTLDSTFGSQGIVDTALRAGSDAAFTVAVAPGGKIVVAGSSQSSPDVFDAALVRYSPDGTLDSTFGDAGVDILAPSPTGSSIIQVAAQPDGKIVASGTLTAPASTNQLPFVSRLNIDGSLDTSFDGTGVASVSIGDGPQYAAALAIEPDGDYLQAAVATSKGQTEFAAVRYLSGSSPIVPVLLKLSPLSFTEGAAAPSQAVATFTDPNGDLDLSHYQATIHWGDGASASPASLSGPDANGVFTILGSHTYAEESGAAPLTITVFRDGTDQATLQSSVPVADAPLAGVGLTLSNDAGATLSGALGSFSDANRTAAFSDFTANIDWGDGTTSTGKVGAGPAGAPGAVGVFVVTGSHVYSDTAAATMPITITVRDVGGSSATIASQAIVSQPDIVGSGATLASTQGATLSGV